MQRNEMIDRICRLYGTGEIAKDDAVQRLLRADCWITEREAETLLDQAWQGWQAALS